MENNPLFAEDQDSHAAAETTEDHALEPLKEIARTNAIDEVMAEELIADFADTIRQAVEWKRKALAITVTDASQVFEMAAAKALGKEIQQARIAVENNRKAKKEQYLRKGKAVDGMANVIFSLIVPLEKHLKTQINFVKIQEEKVEADRRAAADKLLAEQEAADRQAEEQRIKDQAIENARLKQEAEEREAKAAADRAEAARKLKEQEDAAAEQKRKADAKLKKTRDAAAAKVKATQDEADAKAAKERAYQAEKDAAAEREREQIRTSEQAAADAERREAFAEAEKKRLAAIAEAEEKAQLEAEERERVHQEELRQARQVKCPECGHEFDSAEHKAVTG